MTIMRRSETEIDEIAELAELAKRPVPSEAEIDAQAAEDGDAWTDAELAGVEAAWPSPSGRGARCGSGWG